MPCSEAGAVRLAGYGTNTSGRLEVCYDGYWGSVCDDNVTNAVADVVCQQLGSELPGTYCGMCTHCVLGFTCVHASSQLV